MVNQLSGISGPFCWEAGPFSHITASRSLSNQSNIKDHNKTKNGSII
jgi:hypothetical protein